MFSREVIVETNKICKRENLPLSMVLGIAQAESAGSTGTKISFTDCRGVKQNGLMPIIRYEGHKAYEDLVKLGAAGKSKLEAAVKAGLAAQKRGAVKNPGGQKDRYEKLLVRVSNLKGSKFSLTRLGYAEIGIKPPKLTATALIKRLAIYLLFVR